MYLLDADILTFMIIPGLRSHVLRAGMQCVQELKKQGVLALPLGMNLLANYSTSTISLKFIAPLGNQYIAAASLATSTYWMFGKLLVQSLCGALDTRASQVGAFTTACIPACCCHGDPHNMTPGHWASHSASGSLYGIFSPLRVLACAAMSRCAVSGWDGGWRWCLHVSKRGCAPAGVWHGSVRRPAGHLPADVHADAGALRAHHPCAAGRARAAAAGGGGPGPVLPGLGLRHPPAAQPLHWGPQQVSAIGTIPQQSFHWVLSLKQPLSKGASNSSAADHDVRVRAAECLLPLFVLKACSRREYSNT